MKALTDWRDGLFKANARLNRLHLPVVYAYITLGSAGLEQWMGSTI